jgi:uncharacterized damage-inducible protein DinB
MLDLLKEVMSYSEWADAEFFSAWGRSPGLSGNQDLRVLTNHIQIVQTVFLQVLKEGKYNPPSPESAEAECAEMQDRSRRLHAEWKQYLAGVDPASLHAVLAVPWFANSPAQPTRQEAMLQVFLHTHHHRAQNMARLSAVGGEKRIIDYIIWIVNGKPAANWNGS